MSKIEVNEIDAQSGSTITVGSACKSVAVPGNVVKTNAVQASDAGNIISQSGTTITLGASGDTINLASGASQSGFGRAGSVDWQTTVKTGDFTAVSGEGYFVNTTSGEIDVTLPSSPAVGDIVAVSDYAKTFDSNNCIIVRNSSNIEGNASNLTLDAQGLAMTFVYADATKGWKVVAAGREADSTAASFITASGGNTTTTCGDYKIHTFTGPGTFTLTGISATASNNVLDYLVVGGGGSGPTTGGGDGISGGGGAGGFRFFANTPTNPQSGNPASPLNNFPSGTTITATTTAAFPITVGAGGSISGPVGNPGSVSTFSTVTSAGGGRGGRGDPEAGGGPGGSGGGSDNGGHSGGTGNTPPTNPSQGNNGGSSRPANGGGGGGATAVGEQGPPNTGGNGGAGAGVTGFGTTGESSGGKYYFAGGGGGGNGNANAGNPAGTGGLGGGGDGIVPSAGAGPAGAGTTNTGGGGGGASDYNPGGAFGGTGGSGIVIIRYKFQ